MNTIDLHGVEPDNVEFELDRFITNNYAVLPVKVITGHSKNNIDKLINIISRYRLSAHKEMWTNNGAFIVRPKELE